MIYPHATLGPQALPTPVQYQNSTSTVPVQHQYSTSTVPVQPQYRTSTTPVQYQYRKQQLFHKRGLLKIVGNALPMMKSVI